jgi:hypothetical protein
MEPGSKVTMIRGSGERFFVDLMWKNPGTGMGINRQDIGPFWEPMETSLVIYTEKKFAIQAAKKWAAELNTIFVETL